jgi:hypothetical protein
MKLDNLRVDLMVVCIVLFILMGMYGGCEWKQREVDKLKTENAILNGVKDDTLTIIRNKLNQEVATGKVLIGTEEEFKKMDFKKDSTITRLQKLLNKHTEAAAVIDNQTIGTADAVTFVIHDTVHLPHDSTTCSVTYKSHFENHWEKFDILASRDSIRMKYKVFNEYNITVNTTKEGKFLRKRIVETIQIVNLNPNTETKDLKSFESVQPVTKKMPIFGIGVGAGLILSGIIFHEFKSISNAIK